MSRQEITSLLTKVLSEITGISPAEISEDKSLKQDLGVESIDVVDICFEVERAMGGDLNLLQVFQVTPFAENEGLKGPKVKDLIEYILQAKG